MTCLSVTRFTLFSRSVSRRSSEYLDLSRPSLTSSNIVWSPCLVNLSSKGDDERLLLFVSYCLVTFFPQSVSASDAYVICNPALICLGLRLFLGCQDHCFSPPQLVPFGPVPGCIRSHYRDIFSLASASLRKRQPILSSRALGCDLLTSNRSRRAKLRNHLDRLRYDLYAGRVLLGHSKSTIVRYIRLPSRYLLYQASWLRHR